MFLLNLLLIKWKFPWKADTFCENFQLIKLQFSLKKQFWTENIWPSFHWVDICCISPQAKPLSQTYSAMGRKNMGEGCMAAEKERSGHAANYIPPMRAYLMSTLHAFNRPSMELTFTLEMGPLFILANLGQCFNKGSSWILCNIPLTHQTLNITVYCLEVSKATLLTVNTQGEIFGIVTMNFLKHSYSHNMKFCICKISCIIVRISFLENLDQIINDLKGQNLDCCKLV